MAKGQAKNEIPPAFLSNRCRLPRPPLLFRYVLSMKIVSIKSICPVWDRRNCRQLSVDSPPPGVLILVICGQVLIKPLLLKTCPLGPEILPGVVSIFFFFWGGGIARYLPCPFVRSSLGRYHYFPPVINFLFFYTTL